MNKICIYTCIIGEYDYLITPKYARDDVDYVCYTDQNIKSEIWEIRSIPNDICNLDKKIQNKWIKMHPHIILSNYDITIFVDANIFIKDDICSLIDYNKDITLVKSTRANLQKEIYACIAQNKVDASIVNNQYKFYVSQGYEDTQMTYNGILIRKNTYIVRQFNEEWYHETLCFTLRDQISSPYVIWKYNFGQFISYKEYNSIFNYVEIFTHNRYDKEYTVDMSHNESSIKTALCCVTYNENEYIEEFIRYYKNLGIDHIFIYDCNEDNELYEKLYRYLLVGYISIIKWKYVNQIEETLAAYQECYENRLEEYDWCCFFNAYEYLNLYKDSNINEYLNRKMFNNANVILVNNYIIDEKNKYVSKYMRKENRFFKSIVRSGSKIRNFYKSYVNWMTNNIFIPSLSKKYINKVYKSYGINDQYNSNLGLVKRYNYDFCSLNTYLNRTNFSESKTQLYQNIINYI